MSDAVRENAQEINEEQFVNLLAGFEQERCKRLLRLFLIELFVIFVLAAALFFIGVVYSINPSLSGIEGIYFVFLTGIVGLSLWFGFRQVSVVSIEFQTYLKSHCLTQILSAIGNIKHACGKEIISAKKCKDSELFADFEKRFEDDTFEGKYNGVRYAISETCLKSKIRFGEIEYYKSVFDGILINFEANKKIKATTIVTTKGDINIKNRNLMLRIASVVFLILFIAAFWSLKDCWWFWSIVAVDIFIFYIFRSDLKQLLTSGLKKIVLEDSVFNKKYSAYSFDEIEGRYLLTAGFMERFNNIRTAFGSDNIKCSFYDKYLMIAIRTNKDLFEIGSLFTTLKNPKYIKKFHNELNSVFELIDYFKLDEKTGL